MTGSFSSSLSTDRSDAPGDDGGTVVERMVVVIAYAAALYPLFVCFLNTRIARMPNAAIIIAETLIGLTAIPLILARLNLGALLVCLCLCLNFFLLALFQQETEFKALRDLLMPVVFVWLGLILINRRTSERILRNLAIVAVGLGLFEFVFPAAFAELFDSITSTNKIMIDWSRDVWGYISLG